MTNDSGIGNEGELPHARFDNDGSSGWPAAIADGVTAADGADELTECAERL